MRNRQTLLTREEYAQAEDMGNYYRIPADSRDLNYSNYFEDGNKEITEAFEYNSDNTYRLSIEEIKEKLLTLDYVQKELTLFKDNVI